jgi:hypothetical protein
MTTQSAPVQLAEIGLDPHDFKFSDSKSWRGPCPVCGGHRRFVIFTNNEWPLWNGYCDLCGAEIKAWQKVNARPDPVKLAAYQAQQVQDEANRAEYRRKKLAEFTTAELWEELRDRMTQEHINWWETQGVPQDIQRYLSIGFKADKMYHDGEGNERHSPAYTIPWFDFGFQFLTMQYRLTAPDITDRYRFEYGLGGGGSLYYRADPGDKEIKDKVIICEGAKKAIVTWAWLADTPHYSVIATASNKTLQPALDAVNQCGVVYLILDPDSRRKAFQTAQGHKNIKPVYLPEKIDDMVIAGHLTADDFERILEAV